MSRSSTATREDPGSTASAAVSMIAMADGASSATVVKATLLFGRVTRVPGRSALAPLLGRAEVQKRWCFQVIDGGSMISPSP